MKEDIDSIYVFKHNLSSNWWNSSDFKTVGSKGFQGCQIYKSPDNTHYTLMTLTGWESFWRFWQKSLESLLKK